MSDDDDDDNDEHSHEHEDEDEVKMKSYSKKKYFGHANRDPKLLTAKTAYRLKPPLLKVPPQSRSKSKLQPRQGNTRSRTALSRA